MNFAFIIAIKHISNHSYFMAPNLFIIQAYCLSDEYIKLLYF